MTDFEWLDSGPNNCEGHYSMHSKIRIQVPPYIPPTVNFLDVSRHTLNPIETLVDMPIPASEIKFWLRWQRENSWLRKVVFSRL